MDAVVIAQILITVVLAGMGWFLNNLHSELTSQKELLRDTREKYVHKDEIKELKQSIEKRFDRLENILLKQSIKDN